MKKKIDAYSAFLHVALVGLCVVSLMLVLENRRLKRLFEPAPSGPAIGQSVEALQWQPLEGAPTTLDFATGERESLLLVFTTDCPACKKNQEAWRALHRKIGDSVNVLGISLSDLEATRGYRDTHSLPFPVGVPTEPGSFSSAFEISAVPMTIRIGPDGRVRSSLSGTLSERQLSELTSAHRG